MVTKLDIPPVKELRAMLKLVKGLVMLGIDPVNRLPLKSTTFKLGADIPGMLPVILFPCNNRVVKVVLAEMEDGIVPYKF